MREVDADCPIARSRVCAPVVGAPTPRALRSSCLAATGRVARSPLHVSASADDCPPTDAASRRGGGRGPELPLPASIPHEQVLVSAKHVARFSL
jgi:hypothetical protein